MTSFIKKLFSSKKKVNVTTGKKGFQPTSPKPSTPTWLQQSNTTPYNLVSMLYDKTETKEIRFAEQTEKLEKQREEKREKFFASTAQELNMSKEKIEKLFSAALSGEWHFETPPKVPEEFKKINSENPQEYGFLDDENHRNTLNKIAYEIYLREPLPVFVYGTLRKNQGNYGIMEPAVNNVTPGKIYGVGIYGSNYGFPYAAEHENPEVYTVGELVELTQDFEGRMARNRLDQLEGFDSDMPSTSHYERKIIQVETFDENNKKIKTTSWVYLARGHARKSLYEADRISHGDWVKARIR